MIGLLHIVSCRKQVAAQAHQFQLCFYIKSSQMPSPNDNHCVCSAPHRKSSLAEGAKQSLPQPEHVSCNIVQQYQGSDFNLASWHTAKPPDCSTTASVHVTKHSNSLLADQALCTSETSCSAWWESTSTEVPRQVIYLGLYFTPACQQTSARNCLYGNVATRPRQGNSYFSILLRK